MLNKYSFIAILVLSANLLANLSSIGHAPRKQGKPQKENGLAITILDSDIEDVIGPLKKAYLFLKPSRPLPSIDKVVINITKVNSRIVKWDIYKEVIRDPIYVVYWKETIYIKFKTLYLNNT